MNTSHDDLHDIDDMTNPWTTLAMEPGHKTIHFLEYAILSVLVLSVTENTDPYFSNGLLYWMFRDQ